MPVLCHLGGWCFYETNLAGVFEIAMDQIEFPAYENWRARREWFKAQFDIENYGGAYVMGEHASGLLVDLQAIFCAGAFVSTLILACTIIDAHLQETNSDIEDKDSIQSAFSDLSSVEGFDCLRQRRNRLVHFKRQKGVTIAVDDHYQSRSEHEKDARHAINLVARVLFENPWV